METLDARQRGREMIMMGLRLIEGMPLANFRAETQTCFADFVNADRLKALMDEGLMELSDTAAAATPAGRQRLNALLAFLLA
jgi:coproporphyrinogen III oxidase-like Fe-S oxidoreductase